MIYRGRCPVLVHDLAVHHDEEQLTNPELLTLTVEEGRSDVVLLLRGIAIVLSRARAAALVHLSAGPQVVSDPDAAHLVMRGEERDIVEGLAPGVTQCIQADRAVVLILLRGHGLARVLTRRIRGLLEVAASHAAEAGGALVEMIYEIVGLGRRNLINEVQMSLLLSWRVYIVKITLLTTCT